MVTPAEVAKFLTEKSALKSGLETKITTAARPLIAVLLDAGRANSAKELQELFFQLDVLEQEVLAFFDANMEAALAALELLGRGRA